MSLDDYILAHIDPEPDYLHRLWRATHLHLNYPRMASGHLQGRLLSMLTHMIQPHRVLEIGTYSGYSTLCIASALESGAVIHTIEINDEQEDFTRPWLEGSPWADKIRLHIGDAIAILTESKSPILTTPEGEPRSFDLVFIDADKRQYVDYYRVVFQHVRPGGYILADNTLWDGHVVDDGMDHSPHNGKEAQTQGILAFNDLVASDPSVERVILPLRDGITIIRKLPTSVL